MSLTGSFLIAMSFLITNGLGVEFAEMERAVVNTVLVQVMTESQFLFCQCYCLSALPSRLLVS